MANTALIQQLTDWLMKMKSRNLWSTKTSAQDTIALYFKDFKKMDGVQVDADAATKLLKDSAGTGLNNAANNSGGGIMQQISGMSSLGMSASQLARGNGPKFSKTDQNAIDAAKQDLLNARQNQLNVNNDNAPLFSQLNRDNKFTSIINKDFDIATAAQARLAAADSIILGTQNNIRSLQDTLRLQQQQLRNLQTNTSDSLMQNVSNTGASIDGFNIDALKTSIRQTQRRIAEQQDALSKAVADNNRYSAIVEKYEDKYQDIGGIKGLETIHGQGSDRVEHLSQLGEDAQEEINEANRQSAAAQQRVDQATATAEANAHQRQMESFLGRNSIGLRTVGALAGAGGATYGLFQSAQSRSIAGIAGSAMGLLVALKSAASWAREAAQALGTTNPNGFFNHLAAFGSGPNGTGTPVIGYLGSGWRPFAITAALTAVAMALSRRSNEPTPEEQDTINMLAQLDATSDSVAKSFWTNSALLQLGAGAAVMATLGIGLPPAGITGNTQLVATQALTDALSSGQVTAMNQAGSNVTLDNLDGTTLVIANPNGAGNTIVRLQNAGNGFMAVQATQLAQGVTITGAQNAANAYMPLYKTDASGRVFLAPAVMASQEAAARMSLSSRDPVQAANLLTVGAAQNKLPE